MKRYDLALKDAKIACSLMTESQIEKHSDLKTTIKELKVSIIINL